MGVSATESPTTLDGFSGKTAEHTGIFFSGETAKHTGIFFSGETAEHTGDFGDREALNTVNEYLESALGHEGSELALDGVTVTVQCGQLLLGDLTFGHLTCLYINTGNAGINIGSGDMFHPKFITNLTFTPAGMQQLALRIAAGITTFVDVTLGL